jgi:hypothetical protein
MQSARKLEKHDLDEYVEGLRKRFYAEDGRPRLPAGRYLAYY